MEENTAEKAKDSAEETPEFSKIVIGLAVAVLVLGGVIYAGYTYSQKKAGKTVYPAGYPAEQAPKATKNWTSIDCNTDKYDPQDPWPYILKCDRFKTDATTKWITYTDKSGRFTFQIPSTLKTDEYANGLGVIYKDIPPHLNLLFSYDISASRSGELKAMKGEDYVKNYWKQFPGGLTGLKSFELIKNSNDEKGYKAVYQMSSDVPSPSVDIFFDLPGSTDDTDFVHFSTGALDDTVFNTIVGSYKRTVEIK